AEDFGAETGYVKTCGGHGHHLDGAAGETEAERPDGALARPVYGFVQRREDDAFVFKELAEVVGLGQGDVFAEGGAHRTFIFAQVGGRYKLEVLGKSPAATCGRCFFSTPRRSSRARHSPRASRHV